MRAEDFAELGPIAIPPSRHLALAVVVVGGGEEGAKDELRDVHLLHTVHLHGDATPIVPHADKALPCVQCMCVCVCQKHY